VSEKGERCLLDQLGGEAGCRQLSAAFYARIAGDPGLRPLFPGKSMRCATEEFAAFLIQFLDGDEGQTQYRWWLSLRESHARFRISESQRLAWLGHMDATVDSLIVRQELRETLRRFFAMASLYVVGGPDGDFEPGEIARRWGRQLDLDRLIDHIAMGRDMEAIQLAAECSSRRTVFVGVLARMMEAGRDELVAFVLQSIEADPDVANGRFNGRPLLHFAAGSTCLPVVRQLLALGVDPDVMDGGGHTALYRAAGAEIVFALVEAGATVDHCGGVNKSTALHEAARHGRVAVAKALIEAGASLAARDKKGLTPLDRANNCRRRDVAALLIARG
jgi:hemoglobin